MNINEATTKIKELLEREEQEKYYVRSFYNEAKELLYMDVTDNQSTTIETEWYSSSVTCETSEVGTHWAITNMILLEYINSVIGTPDHPTHGYSIYKPAAA